MGTGEPAIARIETDSAPVRYAADEHPGRLVVMSGAAAAAYRVGEYACFRAPMPSKRYDGVEDGAAVDVFRLPATGEWVVDAYGTRPTIAREQFRRLVRHRDLAAALDDAEALAREVIAFCLTGEAA